MVWNSHFAHSRKTISLLIYDYRHVEMARTRRAGNHVCCKEQNSVQHQLCSNLLPWKWVFRLPLSLSQSNYNVLLCKVLILLTSSLLRWLRGRFPIIHKEKESRSISTLCADGLYFIPVSHLPVISASPWTLMWAIFFVPRPWGAVFKKKRRKKKTSLKKKNRAVWSEALIKSVFFSTSLLRSAGTRLLQKLSRTPTSPYSRCRFLLEMKKG